MYVVIVGSSVIGSTLARWLTLESHEVVVVEKNLSKCSELDDELGSVSVVGDGTDEEVLAKAGVRRADAIVAATGEDDINLAVCQIAKIRFGTPRTFCLATNSRSSEIFRLLGVDVVINTAKLGIDKLREHFVYSGLVELLSIAGPEEKMLVSVKIAIKTMGDEKLLKDIPFPEGTIVPLVISKNVGVSVPNDDTLVSTGDEIIILVRSRDLENIKDLLTDQNEDSA